MTKKNNNFYKKIWNDLKYILTEVSNEPYYSWTDIQDIIFILGMMEDLERGVIFED